jgi:hypothetical protein
MCLCASIQIVCDLGHIDANHPEGIWIAKVLHARRSAEGLSYQIGYDIPEFGKYPIITPFPHPPPCSLTPSTHPPPS